jgi:glycerol-3-phosphate acyltransferase PlsX
LHRIALDVMGGDNAPAETVAGAVLAVQSGVDVLLVGDSSQIGEELERAGADLPVVHAPDTIEMGEDVGRALREKPASSVATCARLTRDGEVAGFVSAGSTGAAMAAAALIVGRIPGVLRPTIATIFPTIGTPTVVVDSGANPEVKPEHLVQFAAMGAVFSEVVLGVDRPRVALLNIGEEPGKGRQLEKDTFLRLQASHLRFVGNVEGRALSRDEADVIVTDGFTGNVFLKTVEGAAALLSILFLEALSTISPEASAELVPRLEPIRHRMDYENTGGAHLLGVEGVVVIAHGSSTRRSVSNALRLAADGAERGLPGRVAARIAAP